MVSRRIDILYHSNSIMAGRIHAGGPGNGKRIFIIRVYSGSWFFQGAETFIHVFVSENQVVVYCARYSRIAGISFLYIARGFVVATEWLCAITGGSDVCRYSYRVSRLCYRKSIPNEIDATG